MAGFPSSLHTHTPIIIIRFYLFIFFCFFSFVFIFLHPPEFQRRQFFERMGEAFLLAVLEEYCGALQSLGSDLFGFLQNLGSVYQEMKTTNGNEETNNIVISNHYDISFSCVPEQGRLTLHFRTALAACGYLWAGVLKVCRFYFSFFVKLPTYTLKANLI